MTNLATIATETAERIPDGIAYKLDDTEVNWQAVDEGSARVAGLLKEKGIEPGDRVGVMLPNVPYFPIAYYGILRAGGTVVPMNVLLKGREVKFYLEDPGAKLVFAWHDFAEAAEKGAEEAGAEVVLVKPGEFEKLLGEAEPEREVADRDGDDTAVILYTSGTTGQPKGAELTHDNMLTNAKASHGLFATDDERRRARRAAAVPFLRPDVLHERLCALRRDADVHPALRPGQGARDHRARQGDAVRRRADDVQRDAQQRRAREARPLVAEALLLRRLGDARRAHARLREGVRLQDPRGLRALARPRRSPPSTTPTRSARSAPSARRSRASR